MSASAIRINLPWQECLPLAQATGFKGFDLQVTTELPATAYREALAAHDLKPGGMKLPVNFREDEATFKHDLDLLEPQIEVAAAAGFTRILAWMYPFSDTLCYQDNFALHAERLGAVATILKRHGCRLGLEFLGPKTLRMGRRYSFIWNMQQMLELCAAIGDNAGLLLDSWHWYTSLGTLEDIEALTNEQIVSVHLNDAPKGVPYDQLQDLVRELPGATGVQDTGGFLNVLRSIGYDGPVVPEPFYKPLESMAPEAVATMVGASMEKAFSMAPKPVVPATMKAVGLGGGKAWLADVPVPQPQGNQVIVKIHAAPLCGSNMKAFRDEGETINNGHEAAGEVVAVAESSRLKVGDRVVMAPATAACGTCKHCQNGDVIFCKNRPWFGCAAEYTCVADHVCAKIPDEMSYAHASLMCCALGPAYESLKQLGARAFDTVVISGLGPVGLGATALASFMGIRTVAIDPEPWRREQAKKIGATLTLDPFSSDFREVLTQETDGGIQKAIECSGVGSAQRLLIDLAAVGGMICIVGENKGTIEVSPSHDFIRKGLTLKGCWHMNMNDVPDLIRFLQRCPDKADLLITHQFCFDQVEEAFKTFAGREAAKVILVP